MFEAVRQTGISAQMAVGLLKYLARMSAPASHTLDEYLESLRDNPVAGDDPTASLGSILRESEYVVVTVGLIPNNETRPIPPVIPVHASAYGRGGVCTSMEPPRVLSCAAYFEGYWRTVVPFLADRAGFLVACDNSLAGTPKGYPYRTLTLTFHLPRRVPPTIGGFNRVLSRHAQRYLIPARSSDCPSTRPMPIVDYPHSDLEGQLKLYTGLEVFFAQNRELLCQDQAARSVSSAARSISNLHHLFTIATRPR